MTAQLAAELHAGLPADRRQVIPPAVIVALVQGLVLVLQACNPNPGGATRLLWQPEGWLALGSRRLWVRRIRQAVAAHWDGPSADLRAAQAAVLARVRRGVSEMTVRRLFAEAGP